MSEQEQLQALLVMWAQAQGRAQVGRPPEALCNEVSAAMLRDLSQRWAHEEVKRGS